VLKNPESMQRLLENHQFVLMEGSINEQLRRSGIVELHPRLTNAPLIYDETGRNMLAELYLGYMAVAREAQLPFLMCTPTWRANRERVAEAGVAGGINRDAADFLRELREAQDAWRDSIRIGGLMGCKNDCYKPQEGLSASDAEQFHRWQAGQLQQGGVDFLVAQTLPNVNEAIGIARAMEGTGLPYVVSFVIARDGCVLDGTDLETAIARVDAETTRLPLGFTINCAYPSFLNAARQPPGVFKRLIGYQANASSMDHHELDGADELHRESTAEWGELMLELNRTYGVKILGGCCGTGVEHLRYICREK
jgi:S-methylmethionine-dependent homocysteine/selenocysteine methylase